MKITLKEIGSDGHKDIKWQKNDFSPSKNDSEDVVFNEAFRIALYSYIANFFPNGFGINAKHIPDLPAGQIGRLLYCFGFRNQSKMGGDNMPESIRNSANKVFEIIIDK